MTAIRSSTIGDVPRRAALRTPDRIAPRFTDHAWTHRELDGRWSKAITAFVVAKAGASGVRPDELIARVKGRLAGFEVPKSVRLVDELPRNASGRLLKWVPRGS